MIKQKRKSKMCHGNYNAKYDNNDNNNSNSNQTDLSLSHVKSGDKMIIKSNCKYEEDKT